MIYDHELEIHHHQPLFHGMTFQVSLLKWFEERMPYLERYFKTSELDNLHSTLGNITVRQCVAGELIRNPSLVLNAVNPIANPIQIGRD